MTDTAVAELAILAGRLVRERRSIRLFRDEPLPRDIVEEIFREVIWAPSPHNSQPWRFTVLFEEGDKSRLAGAMAVQLAGELRADGLDEDAIGRQTSRSYQRIVSAPVVVLCSVVSEGLAHYPDRRRDVLEWQMAVQSVGAALQSLFLLAAARGIGSCWMAAPMYCPDVVRKALELPSAFHPQALALLGYPKTAGRVRERIAFERIVEMR